MSSEEAVTFCPWGECSSFPSWSGLEASVVCLGKICFPHSCCWSGAAPVPYARCWGGYDDPHQCCVRPQLTEGIYRCSAIKTVANNIKNKWNWFWKGPNTRWWFCARGWWQMMWVCSDYCCFCLQQPCSKRMSLLLLLQESLEELGESAVSRLKKRRSLISLYDTASDRECSPSPSPSQASPRPVRTPQLLASLGLDLDALSLGNRWTSMFGYLYKSVKTKLSVVTSTGYPYLQSYEQIG